MKNPIRVAIVGVGRWGVHWLRIFSEHPDAQVVAVVDPEGDRLANVKRLYHLGDDVFLTPHWQELEHLDNLDAVIIATPAVTHYSLIKDALRWGLHVLAEKPLTLDPSECRELCYLADQQNRILMVDHTYLFNPVVESGQEVVQGGKLGELRYGYATRTHLGPVRQDVDALWDLAIHDIAIFNAWLGEFPHQVKATGNVWLQHQPTDQNPQGIADLVWANLLYPSGFQACIHLCWLNNDKQRRLGVVGSKATLVFDELSPTPLTLMQGEFEENNGCYIPTNLQQQPIQPAPGEPLKRVCDRFLESVYTSTPPDISSGWVGANLVEVLAGLSTSLHQNGVPVRVGIGL